jgi:very-short-patch-repair endonuclease
MTTGCIECQTWLPADVYDYSLQYVGAPLCRKHQDEIRVSEATPEAIQLYFALRRVGVPAKLEKFDGHKTIDIAIPECKVNIEVDGVQHNFNPNQALADLQRTHYSFLKGYLTLRIPNSLVNTRLDDTAKYITNLLNAKNKKDWKRYW